MDVLFAGSRTVRHRLFRLLHLYFTLEYVSMTKMSKGRDCLHIIWFVCMAVVLCAVLGAGLSWGLWRVLLHTRRHISEFSEAEPCKDRIFFLPTGASDAILLQSGHHFALIDAAEDTDNPRGFPWLEYRGYEQEVLRFLKRYTANAEGVVHLDFIVGTHSHSDHIGGFDTIIDDDQVQIDRAYLKVYDPKYIIADEVEKWDNEEVYVQMIEALHRKNIPQISEIPDQPFVFGNFMITFLNTAYETQKNVGENDNSLALLVEKGGVKALLAGDLDNFSGDEVRVGRQIGAVDLLKVGHHSYKHSTTPEFLKTVRPRISIVTNCLAHADRRTLRRILCRTSSALYLTGEENGVAAIFPDEGGIQMYRDLPNP